MFISSDLTKQIPSYIFVAPNILQSWLWSTKMRFNQQFSGNIIHIIIFCVCTHGWKEQEIIFNNLFVAFFRYFHSFISSWQEGIILKRAILIRKWRIMENYYTTGVFFCCCCFFNNTVCNVTGTNCIMCFVVVLAVVSI